MRKSESGRSMVEMLGVLAIVGVLSVTGIYGYTTAMRKHRVNEILQAASMLAVTAVSADGGTGGCVLLSSIRTELPSGIKEMSADATLTPTHVNIEFEDEVTDSQEICSVLTSTSIIGYLIDTCPIQKATCSDEDD